MELQKRVKRALVATVVGLSICLCAVALHSVGWLQVAEWKSLDYRFRQYADKAKASRDIVLVAIDEASLEAFGRWPWPRDRHGYAVRYLKEAGAKAVIFDLLFLEPDENAEEYDASFAADVRAAGNVVLPGLFEREPDPILPPTQAIGPESQTPLQVTKPGGGMPPAGLKLPLPSLAQSVRSLGFLNLTPDHDGVTRRVPLFGTVGTATLPQIATATAQVLANAEALASDPQLVHIGPVPIPVSADGRMLINWHGRLEEQVYPSYSMGAVLQSFAQQQKGEKPLLDPALFKDKIVFVAATAAGTYELRVTPLSPFTPGVLIHMAALDNLLQGDALRQAPTWVFVVATLILCLGMAWSFMLLRVWGWKLAVGVGLAGAYYALAIHAFTGHVLWMELVFPLGAWGVTFATAATVEYVTEGRQRRQLRAVFDKYMSAEVVDEVMRHPEQVKLGGEKKELTVFFSDVAGFTTISEQLSPEELVALLNKYLSAMTKIIRAQRGNVNKFLGDGIMAIFGAPLGDQNHATLACYAALESQEALVRLRQEWSAQGYPEIVARIGINSGPLVVGNMGSEERLEYTVMGDSVNLASRLEGANKFYDTLILLGPRTYELAKADIEARPVDLLRVKGKKEPVQVYELLARKGQLGEARRQVVRTFLEGLDAYKERNFATAKARFEEALHLDPTDGPSKVYRERAVSYLATPPPLDWDGVYELKSK
jgi:adenylate cyclase